MTYVAENSATTRPIIFHTWSFDNPGCWLWRWRPALDCWEEVDDNHVFVCYDGYDSDDPDEEVNVGQDANFTSLQPGESWTKTRGYLKPRPGLAQPGDRFKFVFKGTTVDWWDWGTKQEQ